MEFVTLVADKLFQYTLIPAARQVGYVFFYKKKVAQLKGQAEELRLARERVQHRVDAATRNVEEIEGEVQNWLTEVNEITQKVKEFEEDERHKNTGCSGRSFPNLWWRHQLGRKAKKLAEEIVEKSKKQFENVSYVPERIIEPRPCGEAFESRSFLLKQIVEALEDPNHNLIGVHGLGGVGKTTLVNQVAEIAKGRSSDLKAIIITVKQTPELKELQQEIAEKLQLKLEEQTLDARARKLHERLMNEKMILMILDDLWEKLDLEKLGIPCGKESKNCKVLMTSRDKDVFSNTGKIFQLEELTSEEAWKLFKEKAELSDSAGSDLKAIAEEVSARCARLPVAIVTVAAALKGKDLAEWRDVQRQLRDHRFRDVNKVIELSYQQLKEARLKSLFLLAGMVTSSSIMDLFKYSCGLGLFDEIAEMKEKQDSFETSIRKLKDLYLLQDSDESDGHFTMHDIVRDTAIMIASSDQQWFLKKNKKLDEEEWAKNDKLKSYVTILLDCNDIERFPERLQFSNLTFFYLHNKEPSLKFPCGFFEGMPALKVLVLIKMKFEILPSSISHLHNLHTLCLHQCVLENIDGIKILKGLKILSLSGSEITDFPREIGQLTKLQLLDLSCYFDIKFIPPNVLSKLKMLEVLLTSTSLDNWAIGNQQSLASLAEIKDLSRLNTLTVHVRDADMLPQEKLFECLLKLQRYKVRIGDSQSYFDYAKSSRSLGLDLHDTGIDSKHYFKSLLDSAEDLVVQRLKGVKNIVPDMNENGLLELKQLEIRGNDDLQFIADSMEHRDLFPSLESLHVETSNLVKLCNGSITNTSFSKLKVVKVNDCSKMKSLFSFSRPTCLPHLNEIEVGSCNPLEGTGFDDGKLAGVVQFIELCTLKIKNVPELIGFYFEDKTSSKAQQKRLEVADDEIVDPSIALFSHKVSLPNLETLDIEGADKLNNIWDQQVQQFDGLSFRNLKILNVRNCHGISKLLPFEVLEFLHNLEKLEVKGCDSLEVIFDLEGTRKGDSTHDAVKSMHLRKLILQDLPKLEHVANSLVEEIVSDDGKIASVQFRELHSMRIENVPELIGFCFKDKTSSKAQQKEMEVAHDSIFDPPIALFSHKVAVPKLENLSISGADKWNGIWDWQYQQFDGSLFQNLKTLRVRNCRGIIKLLPFDVLEFLRNLEKLEVYDCDSLEVIFDLEGARKDEIHAVVKPLHLSVLNFRGLPKLKYLFPVSMPNSLLKLQDLSIQDCGELENIVGGKDGAEVSINFKLSQVTSLKLENLPKLTRFYPGSYSTKWPQLENFGYGCVDKVWNIFGGGLDEVSMQRPLPNEEPISKLRELVMDYNESMMAYLEQYSPDFCFKNLKLLRLESVYDVPSAFPWSFIQRMNTLKTLNVNFCSFEELFPLERVASEETKNDNRIHLDLKELQVEYCSSLLKLVPSSVVFNHLTSLEMCGCDKISYLMAPSTAESLTQLTIMKIRHCHMIKEIVAGEVANDEIIQMITFIKLKTLELQYLEGLESFSSINPLFYFPSLENVIIDKCPSMKTFSKLHPKSPQIQIAKKDFSVLGKTYYEGDLNSIVEKWRINELYYETRSLSLSKYLDLKHIWHSQIPNGAFRKLATLILSNCEWFSKVLPLNVLKCLVNLKELEVENCMSVEAVFDLDQGTTIEERHNVLTMNLSKMTLTSLPNLEHVWNKDPQGILDFPELTKLALVDIPKLDPHSVEQLNPKIIELEVDCNETMMKYLESCSSEFCFRKLEILKLKFFNDARSIFLRSFITKMYTVETLHVTDGSLEVLFLFERVANGETQYDNRIPLKKLILYDLKRLKHICREDNEVDPILKKLEELEVFRCSNLSNLVPSSVTFSHLTSLHVHQCEGILYLMAPSTAKSLSQLTVMKIRKCKKIKEIVARSLKVADDEITQEITFSKLKTLYFQFLPELESFCLMNYIFNFPTLEEVTISNCSQMKIFSILDPNSPKLRNVRVNDHISEKRCWKGDLNSTIQKCYKDELYYKTQYLSLSKYLDLKQTWHSKLPNGAFRRLEVLELSKCEWFPEVLPLNVLKCLVNLEELKVENCKSVEVVFDLDQGTTNEERLNVLTMNLSTMTLTSLPNLNHVWNIDPQGILDFPELTKLALVDVPKLDPRSVEKAFPNLVRFEVDEKAVKTWLGQFQAHHFNKLEHLKVTFFNAARTTFAFEEIFPFEKQAVKEPSSLLNLWPSSIPFNLLKTLKVMKCEQLLYLMASSTAKCLGQLEGLEIEDCRMIKEIIADKVVDAETIDEITFNKLKILKLENLTCLESFCSMNYVFSFPSLENVDIRQCPKLKTFSKQGPNPPKFQNVKNIKRIEAGEWEGDLNSTVQKLWPSSITFNLLKTLKVTKCEQLLYLMASSTAKCLGQLEILMIEDCTMIKEIIADKVVDDEIIEEITFNKLNFLSLENLTCLESFCSMNYAFSFPSLELATVLKCPNLKIFSKGVCYTPILTCRYGEELEECWEGDLNSAVQKLNNDRVASQMSDNALSEVDTMSKNKQLNKLERNHQVEEEKDEESKREDDDREHEEMKLGNKNMKVTQQCTTSFLGSGENGLQTSTNEDFNMSTPLAASSQEIETSEKGDNRKLEDRNITEQTQGFNVPISNFDMTSELPIGRAKEEASDLQKETSKVEIVQIQSALEEECCNQKMMEQSNVTEQSTGSHSESRDAHKKQTGPFNLSINNFDVTSAELSLMRAQVEAFGLQNETSKVNKVQVQLPLESTDTDGGGNANTPNVDLPIDSHSPLSLAGSSVSLVSAFPSLPIVKDTIEINKYQISLLRDAFARYPKLGGPHKNFSTRFHFWAYKTLADLLYFLKTENPMTITKEREKEFHVLCNEAIQFGFDKTWVEDMQQRVAKDPEADHAQKRLNEILEKEQELRQEKEMLNRYLQERRKKCFDF